MPDDQRQQRIAELSDKKKASGLGPAERLELDELRLAAAEERLRQRRVTVSARKRAADARAKIEAGGLVAKAGIAHLDRSTLLGALLDIADALDRGDAKILARWRTRGSTAFDADARSKTVKPAGSRELLVVRFPGVPSDDIRTGLKALGFVWVDKDKAWRGEAAFDDVSALAAKAGGIIERQAAAPNSQT